MRLLPPLFIVSLLLPTVFTNSEIKADIINLQIIDFRDDAEEEVTGPNAGNVFRSSSDLELGNQNGVEQLVGLRFQNVTIPRKSRINSAWITMTATTTDVGTLNIPIYGELAGDTVNFGDATPLSTRTLTSNFVDWNVEPWFPGDSGLNTQTPQLAIIVEEIVGLNDWSSGNSMVFLFQNDPADTSERIAVSYDGNPDQAAILTIDFTAIPEPTSTAGLSFLLAGLLLRRRLN